MDPFHRHYAYHIAYKLNVDSMRQAAKHFIGKHDFSAFVNASRNDRVPDPVKTIFRLDVIEMVIELSPKDCWFLLLELISGLMLELS